MHDQDAIKWVNWSEELVRNMLIGISWIRRASNKRVTVRTKEAIKQSEVSKIIPPEEPATIATNKQVSVTDIQLAQQPVPDYVFRTLDDPPKKGFSISQ